MTPFQEIQYLYHEFWRSLAREEEELRTHFNIARNLACSEWNETLLGSQPTKILPDRTDLLRENYARMLDEISKKRYYLTCAFMALLGDDIVYLDGGKANWEYWESQRIAETQKENV